MLNLQRPIAVLDSGIGGLTVVRELRCALPAHDIVYFGDTARLPYGSKSRETVTRFVAQIIAYLQPLNPSHVVIACNTATALALPAIRARFSDLSISGVIDPGARAAAIAAGAKLMPLITVIATESTVRSGAYQQALHKRRNKARLIVKPTPLLAPMIEEGRPETDPLVQLALKQYLQPIIVLNPDVLVLGCTHYPVFRNSIAQLMGPTCQVIDSARQCAQDVARRLQSGLLETQSGKTATLHCMVSDDPARFQSLARRFLAIDINLPTLVDLDRPSLNTQPARFLRQAG